MPQTTLYTLTTVLAIVVYSSLALYVVLKGPRQWIRWVFAVFCFCVVNYYLSSLFLFPKPHVLYETTPPALQWKWAFVVLSPAAYFHLMSFYFTGGFLRSRMLMLVTVYTVTVGLVLFALFTDLLVAGPLFRAPELILGPKPGPLMPFFTVSFGVSVGLANLGLLTSYRQQPDPAVRRQIQFLVLPVIMLILAAAMNFIIILTSDTGRIPHEIGDALGILAAVFLGRAVLLHGVYTGETLSRREVLAANLLVLGGLVVVAFTTALDRWLAVHVPIPVPLSTMVLVLGLIIAFPHIQRWIARRAGQPGSGGTRAAPGARPAPGPSAGPSTAITGAEAPLHIHLLGPFHVRRRDTPIAEEEWGSEKAKILLVYLLHKREGTLSREDLGAVLWPNRTPDEASNAFHVTLHRLRRALEPDLRRGQDSQYVLHRGGRYLFNREAPCWLDLDSFLTLAGRDDPQDLQAAVDLYRGPYLEDLIWSLPPEVEIQRRSVELTYTQALRKLLNGPLLEGHLLLLEKLLAVEPLDQKAHEMAVRYHLDRGRLDLARQQITRWQEALKEMGMEPEARVRSFWKQVETISHR